jgi:hypothetical protein
MNDDARREPWRTVPAILAELEAQFGQGNATTTLISRGLPDGDGGLVMTPWFQMDYPNWTDSSPAFGVWTEEFVPPVPGSSTPGTRQQFLSPVYDPTKLAYNVRVAVLALADSDRANLLATWQALGLKTVDLPRAYLIVPATDTRQGAIGYAIQLNSAAEPHTEQLGDATLEVSPDGSPIAYLWLTPPSPMESDAMAQLLASGAP